MDIVSKTIDSIKNNMKCIVASILFLSLVFLVGTMDAGTEGVGPDYSIGIYMGWALISLAGLYALDRWIYFERQVKETTASYCDLKVHVQAPVEGNAVYRKHMFLNPYAETLKKERLHKDGNQCEVSMEKSNKD